MHALIQRAAAGIPGATLHAGLRLSRLQRAVGAVLVMEGAVLVFGTERAATEAAALDLADFHAGCENVPVLPVAVIPGTGANLQPPLPLPGAAPVMACSPLALPALLRRAAAFPPVPGLDPARWHQAPYRPVPGLTEAACRLYARHDEARLSLAGSGRGALDRTRHAVAAALAAARAAGRRAAVFVTGRPGAGKTLCGLDLAFDPAVPAAFLTGNPTLVHVLRAALVRDAARRGLGAKAARQRVEAVIQPLHAFRDQYVPNDQVPPEDILVIDEAQRCWTAAFATSKTRNRAVPLHAGEPTILLDVMERRPGWSALVCLVGTGQEIHTGEGGLAEWGHALAGRRGWQVAAPSAPGQDPFDPRAVPHLHRDPALHLGTAVRSFRAPALVDWVDAVLADDPVAAGRLAGAVPVHLTRSLPALRRALIGRPDGRPGTRPGTRYGLLASSGARRLRAEGLGATLLPQDEDAVAHWFLSDWPDIRSADALEVAATEFGAQGLELDRAGLCWDLDLARDPGGRGWQPQAFRATRWTAVHGPAARTSRLNAYRVLLTRARTFTAVWVPEGDARDPTRAPARYDAVAAFLHSCGARALDEAPAPPENAPIPEFSFP